MSLQDQLGLVQLLPEAVFVFSGGGKLLAANRAASQLLGEPAESLEGKDLADLVLDPEEKVRRCLRLWSRNGQMTLSALEWRSAAGGSVPCRCDGARINPENASGSCLILLRCWPKTHETMVGRFSAMNEKIAALASINDRLEERVVQRTAALAEANASLLREADRRKALEEELLQSRKLESIGTLAAGIAHDFNNILNVILGYLSWIERKGFDPPDLPESLEAIRTAAERGAELVRQLLVFARKTEPLREPVAIAAIVEEIAAFASQTFPKTIRIVRDLEELPAVSGDRNQLQQVLLNLCINARDAMPHGGTIVLGSRKVTGAEVKARFPQAEADAYARVTVSDTGVGMSDEVRGRIFEPFFTTKEVGRGTGLGLAVAYGVVRNHGGFIGVSSKKGGGTSVEILLPISAAQAAGARPEVPASSEKEKARGTVLVVEDEPDQRRLMEKILGDSGYRVFTAADGLEALDRFRSRKDEIDVVILDVGLPGMDGAQVLLKIREQKPAAKILLATGYLEPAEELETERGGAEHVIYKPYVPDLVLSKVRELIAESGLEARARGS